MVHGKVPWYSYFNNEVVFQKFKDMTTVSFLKKEKESDNGVRCASMELKGRDLCTIRTIDNKLLHSSQHGSSPRSLDLESAASRINHCLWSKLHFNALKLINMELLCLAMLYK